MKISILFSFLILFIPALLPAQDNTFQLSSHILDISKGLPAVDVNIKLEKMNETGHWIFVDERKTDQNGRVKDFLEQKPDSVNAGIYQLTYQVKPYFEANQLESFYPFIVVVFEIKDNNHYHVPITLSPFGYSTYRGN
ncbi:MAG: hydroxyisourate hydrolase [Lentimicrobium sp.]|jgi:5-hydroxyisourate hydrolase|nr:hydroxyisourate hydrolase [Lentimicrobium sp.]